MNGYIMKIKYIIFIWMRGNTTTIAPTTTPTTPTALLTPYPTRKPTPTPPEPLTKSPTVTIADGPASGIICSADGCVVK